MILQHIFCFKKIFKYLINLVKTKKMAIFCEDSILIMIFHNVFQAIRVVKIIFYQ